MISEAFRIHCPNGSCPTSARPIRIAYDFNYLFAYNPQHLPEGVEHREWESDDPRNTAADGFVVVAGLFCVACGTQMLRQ